MTVQTQTGKVVYVADGQTATYTVPFYFFDKEIEVCKGEALTVLAENTDYTIKNAGNPQGGEVIFNTPPESGELITIRRNVELKQLITFIEGEKFPASDYEYSLDKIVMALQQLRDKINNSLSVPEGADINFNELWQTLLVVNDNLALLSKLPELIEEMKKVKTELPSNFYDKETIDKMLSTLSARVYKNIKVQIKDIEQDSAYENYPYHTDIALADTTENAVPAVTFALTEALSGNMAPIADSYNGGVRIYMKQIPEADFIIPSIIIH